MKKSNRIVSRLSRYKDVLYRLKDAGMEKIYSDLLAEEVGVTSSQVRKDFSFFNLTGNKRAGYSIVELIEKLDQIFHKDIIQKVIIVGAGRLGSALANYRGFTRQKIEIVASFDIAPSKFEGDLEFPVYHMDELPAFIEEHDIEMALLTVPVSEAQNCYEKIAAAGIKGVLNFAPMPLKEVEGCIVSTYSVEVELDKLIYFVNEAKKEDE